MKIKEWIKPVNDYLFEPRMNDKRLIEGHLSKPGIIDRYGNCELESFYYDREERVYVLNIVPKIPCENFKAISAYKLLTEFERGYRFAKYGDDRPYETIEEFHCMGTKGQEFCRCGGDKNKCDFYKFNKNNDNDNNNSKGEQIK